MGRRSPDLVAGVALAALGAGVVTLVPELPPLRVAFALPLLLALPGYSLTAALFPGRELDWPRRLLLSVSLSLSLAIVTGLALNATPFGLRGASWAVALLVVTVAASCIAVVRRARADAVEARLRIIRVRARDVAILFVALCVVGGALAFARTPLPAKKVLGYTALWLLPGNGERPASVRVGLKSGELQRTRYRLLVRVGPRVIFERRGLELDPSAEFDRSVRLPAPVSAGDAPVEALLYREDRPSSIYRRATFWPSKTAPS